MKIKTGYFAYTKKYEELGYRCISIARVTPKWFRGICLPELAPTFDLLDRYKRGLVSEVDYKEEYEFMLKRVNIDGVLKNFNKDDKIIFLCYEKSSSFCHRHILAEYLNTNYGLDVKEYVFS